ncbi:hypothetical protein FW754_05655 [Acinetobacter sp. 1207_04]
MLALWRFDCLFCFHFLTHFLCPCVNILSSLFEIMFKKMDHLLFSHKKSHPLLRMASLFYLNESIESNLNPISI